MAKPKIRLGRFLICCALACLPLQAMAQDKPNIVLIFMDNFGWGEPGFNGGGITRGAATPRLDKLASEGLRLTNFNVEVQCTPSRSALMTGRYAIRSGNGTVPLGEGVYGLVQWEVTMAEMLSEAGYATGMYGKWHLGRTKGRFPTDQGFDEWYGVPNSTDESVYTSLGGFADSCVPASYVMEAVKGAAPKKVRVYDLDYRPLIDRDLTDRAIAFMKKQAGAKKPFFLYLTYTATHFPTMPHPAASTRLRLSKSVHSPSLEMITVCHCRWSRPAVRSGQRPVQSPYGGCATGGPAAARCRHDRRV